MNFRGRYEITSAFLVLLLRPLMPLRHRNDRVIIIWQRLRPLGIALGICLTLACAHRQLDTRISGHHAENLRAEAQKVEGGWRVTLQLPIGEWQVKTPNEEQRIQVIPGIPYSIAQWTVEPERWAKERPLDLLLEGSGFQIPIAITYRHDLPRWAQFALITLAGGPISIPDKK